MKRIIKIVFPALLLIAMLSCNKLEFKSPDYGKSTTYFANQTPIRTLVLGANDPFDNTKDNNLQISIPVSIGGMSDNSRDRKVGYTVDETLVRNLYTSTGDTLVALPQAYYTLSDAGTVIIPKGSMQGFINVQLNDAFLNDPKALSNHYVIPLKLISAETDSILQGKPAVDNPDRRVPTDWAVSPKDYTIFGIKYINMYHGNYLYFGKASIKSLEGIQVNEAVYSKRDIADNEILMLNNTGRGSVSMSTTIPLSLGNAGNVNMILSFDDNGVVTVKKSDNDLTVVSGTGSFLKEGIEVGGIKRNRIALNYSYTFDYAVEPTATITNDADPRVSYSGTWNHNAEGGNYNGDRSYANTVGASLEFDFTGYQIDIYTKTAPTYGYYDVYIDDELVATDVSTVGPASFQVKTYTNDNLTNDRHHLKCVVKSEGAWCIFDYFQSTSSGIIPNGTYTWNVNDTLVVYDRAVSLEGYTPVIK